MGTIRSCSPSLIRCLSQWVRLYPQPTYSLASPQRAWLRRTHQGKVCMLSWTSLLRADISINLVWIGTFYFLASHIFYNTLLICVFSTSFKFKTGYFQCPVQTTPPGSLPHPSQPVLGPHLQASTSTLTHPLRHPGPQGSSPCEEGPHRGAFICQAPGLQAGLPAGWGHGAFGLSLNWNWNSESLPRKWFHWWHKCHGWKWTQLSGWNLATFIKNSGNSTL